MSKHSIVTANGKAMSDFDRDCGRCSLIRISEPEVGAYYLVVIAPNRAFVHLSTFSKGQIILKGHCIWVFSILPKNELKISALVG